MTDFGADLFDDDKPPPRKGRRRKERTEDAAAELPADAPAPDAAEAAAAEPAEAPARERTRRRPRRRAAEATGEEPAPASGDAPGARATAADIARPDATPPVATPPVAAPPDAAPPVAAPAPAARALEPADAAPREPRRQHSPFPPPERAATRDTERRERTGRPHAAEGRDPRSKHREHGPAREPFARTAVSLLVDLPGLLAEARAAGGELALHRLRRTMARERSVVRAICFAAIGGTPPIGFETRRAAEPAASAAELASVAAELAAANPIVLAPSSPRMQELAETLRTRGYVVELTGFGAEGDATAALGRSCLFVP